MAKRCKARVRSCSLAGIAGSNSSVGMDVCPSLVPDKDLCDGPVPLHRNPPTVVFLLCDLEASRMRRLCLQHYHLHSFLYNRSKFYYSLKTGNHILDT
jgi:hypothetical protein